MNIGGKSLWNEKPTWLVIGVFLTACIAFPLICAWQGYPLYRDIHLGTAVEYARTSISFENTRIVGFNATGTPTIQEFPFWQMLAAMAFKVMGPWWGWANLVSILIFVTSLYPLYMLGKAFMGHRGGLWTLVFYLTQPLVFRYFGMASTDGMSISAMVWFLFLGFKLLTAPAFRILLWTSALIAGIATALLKLPFFMAAGIALFLYHLISNARSVGNWVSLGSIGILSSIVFMVWTNYTGKLQAEAVFPLVDLRFSNPEMKWWYFGDWNYRLSPGNWIKGGWRILNCLFGSFVLVGLGVLGIWKSRPLWLPLCMLLGCAMTTLLFSQLVLHHSHYYLMLSPAVALLCANALTWIANKLLPNGRRDWMFAATVAILLGLSLIQGLLGMKISAGFDPYSQYVARIVEKYTTPQDKLLIQGGGWGGDILIRTQRPGLSIWNTGLLEDEVTLQRLKSLGYNKLVMISESPLLHAIQVTNPGDGNRMRHSYEAMRTAVVANWPILYQNEDVLIQGIP